MGRAALPAAIDRLWRITRRVDADANPARRSPGPGKAASDRHDLDIATVHLYLDVKLRGPWWICGRSSPRSRTVRPSSTTPRG